MTSFFRASETLMSGSQTLPGHFYTSAETYRAELEQIFYGRWLCAGRSAEIPNSGDYILEQVGDESLIVLRDQSGELKKIPALAAEFTAKTKGMTKAQRDAAFAAIFGSATEPEATTRFSDIDLLLLVRGDRFDPRWGPVAQRLRRSVPNLSVHVDNMTSLRRRAPLMVCRLLGEYHLVIRDAASEKLIWPEHQWLCDEARYWSQTAVMALANRMAHLENGGDPLRDAWFASKTALTAMRFRQLKRGGRSTHWRTILQSASEDVERMHMVVPTIIEALEIAREHRPPPPSKAGESSRFLAAALECVACAQGDYGAGGGH